MSSICLQTKKINQLKKEIESILSDNKAAEITSIDLKDKTSIADFMIIASGNSSRHIQALSEILLERRVRPLTNLIASFRRIAHWGDGVFQDLAPVQFSIKYVEFYLELKGLVLLRAERASSTES